eukprot:CAMPEP_0174902768 /NCGR_PEP_ID=MMETSP0167-20121228/39745_1 /TAXON_ID=38298 /ORGANISM="Rhodella maculata, Strain CCMP736" /LENGTH=83 /DNA_ID=CAMNT_0016144883 /DNA_START=427 /DNA_END=675 /DNA_ORIENTATION=-
MTETRGECVGKASGGHGERAILIRPRRRGGGDAGGESQGRFAVLQARLVEELCRRRGAVDLFEEFLEDCADCFHEVEIRIGDA